MMSVCESCMHLTCMHPSWQRTGLFTGIHVMLCRSDGDVLLLLRNSQHNDNTWGLPGGNADGSDQDLLATALREGTEEMGSVPPCNVSGQILTKCPTDPASPALLCFALHACRAAPAL